MSFQSPGEVRYYTFDSLQDTLTVHAIFTRQGGVSPVPWNSLNIGGTVGDDPAHVRENRLRAFNALQRDPATIFDVWQVHSADAVIANVPRVPQSVYPQADIILTDRPEVTLFMRFADCVPILLFDPLQKAVGMVHAGWIGTVKGAAWAAVQAMQAHFGSRPFDLLAAIGPSIGPDHYEVGPDVVVQVKQAFGPDAAGLLQVRDGRMHFDLWAANRLLLERAGVRQVEVAGLCTACHSEDWYSHRREKGRTGRFGAMIALRA